jgi:broad specificity phosphatase PhoE
MHTCIHTIRHARTLFGDQQRYAGTLDVPLSREGRREAKAAAAGLRDARFDVVITSTKMRAIDTAKLLVGASTPTVKSGLCDERNYGAMEGLTALDVKRLKPKILFIKVGNDTHSVNPPGGEPLEDLRERARKFCRFVFKRYRGSSVLVVSHGVFLQQFHGLLRGKSCIESLADWPSNLQMTSFTFAGNRLLETRSVNLIESKRFDW